MECSQWNEKGLLFTSGELDKAEIKTFSSHLQECSFCKRELEQYEEEKTTFFIPEYFEETPPGHIDNEIIRVCSKARNYTAPHLNIRSVFKNAIFSILVLAIGFGGGTYFSSLKNSVDSKTVLNKKTNDKIVNNNETSGFEDVASNKTENNSETSDSLNHDSLPKTYRRGDINMGGVHSVTDQQ